MSRLYVVDFETGELLKTLDLRLSDGTDHTGHAGGIATDGCTVWITGDSVANEYSLEEILGTEQGFVQSQRDAALPIRGDFCCWTEEALWIGDFFKKPFYPVPDDNPLLLKYVPNGQPGSSAEETAAGPGQPIPDYGKPQAVISLPRKVQGMAITENHRFVFTQSFTNMILSTVSVYENVLEEKPGEIIFNGEILPYYRFTDSNRCSVTRFPPMAEGLFCRRDAEGEKLYLLFENSSDAYFFAFPKVTNVISCTLPLNAQ